MKAIGYTENLPATDPASLQDMTLPDPVAGPNDLLVAIAAISVNPVDTKVRMRPLSGPGPGVLGYDAVGHVTAIGAAVRGFAIGDRVFYAGALDRPGTNSELHLVDYRIVGHAPASLSSVDAAALPLTAITAWELLFDRLGVPEGGGDGDALLIVGGAGGVGSILIQLARTLTRLTVIATASRPETTAWCRTMGAHHVIDHHADMPAQLASLGLPACRYITSLTQTGSHFPTLAGIVAPQGKIGLIDDPKPTDIDIGLIKRKSASLHWEFMFTRSLFGTADIAAQGLLLNRVATLVDQGRLVSTRTGDTVTINAANLRQAHLLQESGTAMGKTVLSGF